MEPASAVRLFEDYHPITSVIQVSHSIAGDCFCILYFAYSLHISTLPSHSTRWKLQTIYKKQGGFIPGIRPGKPTSDYLTNILNYIIFIGAVGLIIVCVIPFIFNGVFGANVSFGGTSIIIIVGVILETVKQIESQLLVRNYKGFLNN